MGLFKAVTDTKSMDYTIKDFLHAHILPEYDRLCWVMPSPHYSYRNTKSWFWPLSFETADEALGAVLTHDLSTRWFKVYLSCRLFLPSMITGISIAFFDGFSPLTTHKRDPIQIYIKFSLDYFPTKDIDCWLKGRCYSQRADSMKHPVLIKQTRRRRLAVA